ncbi:nuclease-related domain-containing protein [Streptomyces sp. NPDC046821]|uniref:nuclease-related domain-containing protein n=1 Tax=Streptomyces sp. NPDC046821 TaxID=3154702 RepID=UPI0033F3AD41
MSGLRVVPSRRQGRERLYVCADDGANVAWYDRETARVNLISEARRDDVLAVLAPFITGDVTVGPPPVPTPLELARLTLHPDDDLAPNRPGEALQIAVERDPGPARRLRADPRRRALEAEQAVGRVLDAFERAGWRTLHSVPLPGGARIHHLLIGPGGLYALHTLPARKQRVRVADPLVAAGRAEPAPLLRRVRAEASRASFALTAEVHPVLAVAGATSVEVRAASTDVRVIPDTELQALSRTGGVLKPADIEALHAMARDRHTWLHV